MDKKKRRKKSWDELTICDDFIFAKLMREEAICKEVIELLLDVKVNKIEYVEYQKTIDISYEAKSVRLDVYTQDDNRIFNLEMQLDNHKDLPRRSRYYQALIDLNAIEKGEYYKDLKESYVVFICTFDPFKKGLPKYEFVNTCMEEEGLQLEDGTHKVYFNAKAYRSVENQKIQAFLRYINGEQLEDEFVHKIEERVKRIKENQDWRAEYMVLMTRLQDSREEGREEGREAERKQNIINLYHQTEDEELIFSVFDCDEVELREILNNKK
ncbi:MAG: Rpn family recombination-promoting nuclease/putative transposase [Eubacteriales bacterium]